MEPSSIYIIILLSGILLGIGLGSRLTTGVIRYQERYRDPVYVNAHRREEGWTSFAAAAIFVLLLLALITWGNWQQGNQLREPPGIEQEAGGILSNGY